MYLFDTNVVSELRKGQNANQGVLTFMAQLQALNAKVFLSVVTIGELRRGIEAIRHRRDFAQAQLLEAWFNNLVQIYAEHILPIDSDIAQLWGHLRVPNPHNELDKLIAATALIYDLTVVTRNIVDFKDTSVKLHNPFS